MSIIQDKLGNEFLRNGGMEPNFAPGMIMFSHLPPVTSFTRIASQSVMQDLPQEMILKKERDSPDHGSSFIHSMGIKQEKMTDLDYRMPLYGAGGGAGAGKSSELLEMTLGGNQNLLVHDLSLSNLSNRLVKDPKESSGRRGRRSNSDGAEGKVKRKRGDSSKTLMLDNEGASLSPNSKSHVCEHCNAAFRSSYHLRRHVLIHTGERPFRCSQCNMSFIQKYLLQRHEKIHSGEKPFSCDQCNMRFIQKYHMERHKRTHSGEKPYKCDTCQQYFSRTDRLLKHKRTCGEAIKKGQEGGMLDLGESGPGSYTISQGSASGRKRGKSKGEGGERKRKKVPESQQMGLQDYSMEASADGRTPKPSYKKGGHKGLGKEVGEPSERKPGSMEAGSSGLEHMTLLQGASAKQGGSSGAGSNYDDAMQFLKKRRYLHAVGGVEYGPGPQPSVIQGVMDGETSLSLLDSPMGGDVKHDKSGIPDEVLQSLLEHYTQKPDGPFELADQHVELHPASANNELDPDAEPTVVPALVSGDKSTSMQEYSKFLLQALERTSHSAGFFGGPPGLFIDKQVYGAPPSLECTFPQTITTLPKSHFTMQPAFHLSALEAAHQQLTPSQELAEQLEKQHSPTFQDRPAKDRSYQLPHTQPTPQELDPSKNAEARASYQIENFAQAFGSQFKAGARVPLAFGADATPETDHRIRTPGSEFSGYTSLLAEVSEPVSTGAKTPTSQSYR